MSWAVRSAARETVRQRICRKWVPLVYVNMVGGQDELVFDGGSFAMQADGELAFRARPSMSVSNASSSRPAVVASP